MRRIFRSPRADFTCDAARAPEVYSDRVLADLAASGFNGIWIRGLYHQLAQVATCPEFGHDADRLLAGLRQVCARGAEHGVGVYLYLQEPMGLPAADAFWQTHPEWGGLAHDHRTPVDDIPCRMRAMCTSTAAVRQYLRQAAAQLARGLPELGGMIMITASEFMSHCYSHYRVVGRPPAAAPLDCPRCRTRSPIDIVSEILEATRQGLDDAAVTWPLIAWNWSWSGYEADPQPGIISRLRPGIEILGDFERGGKRLDPTGHEVWIDEYSLSYAGPSERFVALRQACREAGIPVSAKLQLGTTHELATVSNLPLLPNLFDKAKALQGQQVAGFLGCWNFGNELSLNTTGFNFFLSAACPESKDAALLALAAQAFPGSRPELVCSAWAAFCAAFDWYPFSIPFLYQSPINYALALPLEPGPLQGRRLGRSWLMDERGDDLAAGFGPFSGGEIVARLARMIELWRAGLDDYQSGLATSTGATARAELRAAQAVYYSLRSAWNAHRAYLLKQAWSPACQPAFAAIVADELQVLEAAIPVFAADPRQGFHEECQGRMVSVEVMQAKLARLRAARDCRA